MDDLKVYANDTEGLQAMINRVHRGSAAVGMALGLQKCGIAHMKRGKVVQHGNPALRGRGRSLKSLRKTPTSIWGLTNSSHHAAKRSEAKSSRSSTKE